MLLYLSTESNKMSTVFKEVASKSKAVSDNWKEEKSTFTVDDLLDAYTSGKEASQRILKQAFENNITTVISYSAEILAAIHKLAFPCTKAYIKPVGLECFSTIYFVQEGDTISKKFDKIYKEAEKIRSKAEQSNLFLDFTFVPYTDTVEDNMISADGYSIKYIGKPNVKSTR